MEVSSLALGNDSRCFGKFGKIACGGSWNIGVLNIDGFLITEQFPRWRFVGLPFMHVMIEIIMEKGDEEKKKEIYRQL